MCMEENTKSEWDSLRKILVIMRMKIYKFEQVLCSTPTQQINEVTKLSNTVQFGPYHGRHLIFFYFKDLQKVYPFSQEGTVTVSYYSSRIYFSVEPKDLISSANFVIHYMKHYILDIIRMYLGYSLKIIYKSLVKFK